MVVVKKGEPWHFAHVSGISNEEGEAGKTHRIIGGLPKIARGKSIIDIAPVYIIYELSLIIRLLTKKTKKTASALFVET